MLNKTWQNQITLHCLFKVISLKENICLGPLTSTLMATDHWDTFWLPRFRNPSQLPPPDVPEFSSSVRNSLACKSTTSLLWLCQSCSASLLFLPAGLYLCLWQPVPDGPGNCLQMFLSQQYLNTQLSRLFSLLLFFLSGDVFSTITVRFFCCTRFLSLPSFLFDTYKPENWRSAGLEYWHEIWEFGSSE